MKYKPSRGSFPHGKPRVYFCCHDEDFGTYFEAVSNEILARQNCSVWYREDKEPRDQDFEDTLKQMQLFVIPITEKLLSTENDALNIEFRIAIENHIPVLPLMQESGLDEMFNQKCGQLHYLDRSGDGASYAGYLEKLGKYLSSVLIGDKMEEKIRAAFDAYVFLSYRKKDRKYAQKLMRLIHEIEFCRDFAIWYDEYLTPGENFNESIQHAIHKSDIFVMAVTPNLINEINYVLTEEYPMAQREKKPILPAELVPTERERLQQLYPGIPAPTDAYDSAALLQVLRNSADALTLSSRPHSPAHDFFIGLAYLGGVDLEVNHTRALALIQSAADADLPEAMAQLVAMYTHAVGVTHSKEDALYWSRRLGNFYYKQCFTSDGILRAKETLQELFSHYQEESWADAIRFFLLDADAYLEQNGFRGLMDAVLELGIREYTLLFDTCKEMQQHRETAQCLLAEDILTKSIDGTYPAYGPLFWYVPQYDLYEPLLLAAARCRCAKALALTRDVTVLFRQVYTAREITDRIDPEMLYRSVCTEFSGVRQALCEMFYTGKTAYSGGDAIYPRCFNVGETAALQDHHCGLFGKMDQPFADELGLYSHTMYPELNGEYIGIVAAPYNKEEIEQTLAQKPCGKVRGLFLSATENQCLTYIDFMRRSVKALYLPENITHFTADALLHMDLELLHYASSDGIFYYDRMYVNCPHVILPEGLKTIPGKFFWESPLRGVYLPDSIQTICDNAFFGCAQLQEIAFPPSVRTIGDGAFCGCGSLMEVSIPGTVEHLGKPITPEIQNVKGSNMTFRHFGAFERCTNLSKVHIAEGVQSIGENAFCQCKALEAIELPGSVATISKHAFEKCEKLTEFTFPEGITEAAYSLFEGCTNLRSVKLSDSVRDIQQSAFQNCQSLAEINIGPNVKQISHRAFQGCTGLTSLQIPESVTTIGSWAFKGCTGLTSVTLPEGLEFIGSQAFQGCTSLESLDIPNSVRFLGESSMEGCTNLRRATLPDGIRKVPTRTFKSCHLLSYVKFPSSAQVIENAAFYGCRNLRQPVLPDRLAVIGKEAFALCHELTALQLPAGLSKIEDFAFKLCLLRSLVIPDRINHIAKDALFGCALGHLSVPDHIDIASIKIPQLAQVEVRQTRLERNYVIPEGIAAIADSAFEGNSYLESVYIPETVEKVGTNAFAKCTSLEEVYISDGVEIGDGTFSACSALRKVRLPSGLPGIAYALFSGCPALEEIRLPQSVREIGSHSFYKCHSLKRITLPHHLEKLGDYAFAYCGLTSVDIPEGITVLKSGAFADCEALHSVTIAQSVEVIDDGAFMKCTGLESVTIPERVIRLGRKDVDNPMYRWDATYCGVFEGCIGLTAVHLGESLQMLGDHTFEGCSNLRQIRLPESLEYLGGYAFAECTSLQHIVIPEGIRSLFATFDRCSALAWVTLPKQLQRIGAYVFQNCEALTDVRIPNGVMQIGRFAFMGCRSLTSIRLPDALEDIGVSAFADCTRLTEIEIPANVRRIGADAFRGCSALKAITISCNFQDLIEDIFGQIDPEIITFV